MEDLVSIHLINVLSIFIDMIGHFKVYKTQYWMSVWTSELNPKTNSTACKTTTVTATTATNRQNNALVNAATSPEATTTPTTTASDTGKVKIRQEWNMLFATLGHNICDGHAGHQKRYIYK